MDNPFPLIAVLYFSLLIISISLLAYLYVKSFKRFRFHQIIYITFFGHLGFLLLFNTVMFNNMPPETPFIILFDILLYTLIVIGVIAIYKGVKAKEKIVFILIPTTLLFIYFILPILLMPFR